MSQRFRVGVLTGGGDCPGLNAVIRAVTKSLILQHNAQVIGFEDGFLGLIERRIRPLSYSDVSGILTRGGTILGTSNKANPFNYHERGGADVSAQVARNYEELGLRALITIGGDGTMSISHRLNEMGIKVVGVPKTIDNDLVGTERTFGFDTAVSIATEAIDRLHTTAQSHNRVMIIETMGRYAGWIALFAGTAGGADIILMPELDYDIESVARICREREMGGQNFTIIAIAEGAKPVGGELTVKRVIADSPDPVRLGGIGYVLGDQLRGLIRSEVRTSVLGHIQRGGTPTAYDRNLATAYGSFAASMVIDGRFGRMVALQGNQLTSVRLEEVANKTRTVPMDTPMVAAALAVGTSFGIPGMDVRFEGHETSGSVS
ncbi:MAG: ATP-dependent 6-phosphofructokinase [Rhodothermales bacterium]|nr:ATP-dependent 6-phosphofructokinase [Rhodothermales bacterium]